MSLSRLHADLFTKNLHYAANYWMEHEQNFSDTIDKLMGEETLLKVANSAAALTVTFNHKIEWVPSDYNTDVIHLAYANFMEEIRTNKHFLVSLSKAYFNVFVSLMDFFDPSIASLPRDKVDPKNSPELLNLKRVFRNPAFDNTELAPFAEMLLGKGYSVEGCFSYFYPQLMLFLLRFLDIYDQSMQGCLVKDYLEKDFNINAKKKNRSDEREKLMKDMGHQILISFGTTEFWSARYSKVTPQSELYDWYISWPDLKKILSPFVTFLNPNFKPKDPPRVLHVGCGNSEISEAIYDSGISQYVAGVDFSQAIIDVMLSRRDMSKRNNLMYEHMDVRGLRYDNTSFDFILDKGCLDCMVCTPDGPTASQQHIMLYFREMARVLRLGGYYVLVSCGIAPHSFTLLQVEQFGWRILKTLAGDGEVQPKEGLKIDINIIICQREK